MKHERKTIQSNQSNQDKMTQSVKCLDLKCGSMYVEGEGGWRRGKRAMVERGIVGDRDMRWDIRRDGLCHIMNYLLVRMEWYRGIIVATNDDSNECERRYCASWENVHVLRALEWHSTPNMYEKFEFLPQVPQTTAHLILALYFVQFQNKNKHKNWPALITIFTNAIQRTHFWIMYCGMIMLCIIWV